jgi:hypothetical protein
VTLSNSGSAALTLSSITASGNFAETNNCGSSLAAVSSCAISITFTPQSTGALSGTLTITDNSNAVTGSTQTVSLSGTGMDFSISVTPSSQTVSNGQSATYTITLAAVSGFNGTVSLACSGGPANSTCAVSPVSLSLSGNSSTAHATIPKGANHGTYTLTLTGTSTATSGTGTLKNSASATLTVK